MSAGSRQPAVQGATAECPVGLGLHLCRDLDGLRLRRLRHRRLRPSDRRLAGLAHGACRLRARCAGAGAPRSAAGPRGGLVHHSDRGVQYVSIKYTERLAEAGLEPRWAASATATTMPSRKHQRSLQGRDHSSARPLAVSIEAVEFATLEWVDWFNNRRLLEPIGTSRRPKRRNATTQCWNAMAA